MWPVFSEINETAYQPYAAGEMTMEQAIDAAGKPLKTFMLKQTQFYSCGCGRRNSLQEGFFDKLSACPRESGQALCLSKL